MNWSFALVNGKLAEVFFERQKGELRFIGHCYVKESDYKTDKEKNMLLLKTSNK